MIYNRQIIKIFWFYYMIFFSMPDFSSDCSVKLSCTVDEIILTWVLKNKKSENVCMRTDQKTATKRSKRWRALYKIVFFSSTTSPNQDGREGFYKCPQQCREWFHRQCWRHHQQYAGGYDSTSNLPILLYPQFYVANMRVESSSTSLF